MATVTNSTERVEHQGNRKIVTGTLTFTGTYLTGGESVPGSLIGLELELNDLDPGPARTSAGVFQTHWDKANNKIMLMGAVDATPAANEQSPELANAAIPGGPATIRYRAKGLGSAA